MKQLIDLLKATPIERMEGNSQVRIIDVTADSRAVETGSLFFCLRGEHVDGHNFANMAAENGAAAIIAEKENRCGLRCYNYLCCRYTESDGRYSSIFF